MAPPTTRRITSDGEGDVSEQTPLLRRTKNGRWSDGSSVSAFLRWHAMQPLPVFESGEKLPSAYIPPLLLQCVITGLADASGFSLTKTWVGFMTGNMVQMIINSFDVLAPSDSNAESYAEAKRRLISCASAVVGFCIGCQVTAHLVKRLATDRTKRITIVGISIWRSLLTLTIVLVGSRYQAFRLQESLGWLVIAILSTSLGCQSTYSVNLATPFSNTVVFTATLTEVSSDLHLPFLQLSTSNSFKLLSMLGLLGGATVAQTILKVVTRATKKPAHVAVQRALLALSLFELCLALLWLFCGAKRNWRQFKARRRASIPQSEESHLNGAHGPEENGA